MTTPAGGAPTISVVVPTHERPAKLARLVAALEAQDIGEPFEVVIVDDGSSAAAWTELERLAATSSLGERIRPLRQPRNAGPAVARNRGWREAGAPLLAFTDDDCEPQPGWLRHLVAGLALHDVVQGETRPDPLGRWGPFSRSIESTSLDWYPTCNVGYRRDLLERLGGFDTAYRVAIDDTDLAMRAKKAGASTAYVPEALVHHEVTPSSYRAYLREKPRWETVPLICREHPEVRALMHRRRVWRSTHLPAVQAGASLVLLAVASAAPVPKAVRLAAAGGGVASLVPYVRLRTGEVPLPGTGPRRRVLLLPAVLAGDLYEVGILVRGSFRYRTFVL